MPLSPLVRQALVHGALGAGVGGLTGAVAGGEGHRLRGAALGAGVGGAAAGGASYLAGRAGAQQGARALADAGAAHAIETSGLKTRLGDANVANINQSKAHADAVAQLKAQHTATSAELADTKSRLWEGGLNEHRQVGQLGDLGAAHDALQMSHQTAVAGRDQATRQLADEAAAHGAARDHLQKLYGEHDALRGAHAALKAQHAETGEQLADTRFRLHNTPGTPEQSAAAQALGQKVRDKALARPDYLGAPEDWTPTDVPHPSAPGRDVQEYNHFARAGAVPQPIAYGPGVVPEGGWGKANVTGEQGLHALPQTVAQNPFDTVREPHLGSLREVTAAEVLRKLGGLAPWQGAALGGLGTAAIAGGTTLLTQKERDWREIARNAGAGGALGAAGGYGLTAGGRDAGAAAGYTRGVGEASRIAGEQLGAHLGPLLRQVGPLLRQVATPLTPGA